MKEKLKNIIIVNFVIGLCVIIIQNFSINYYNNNLIYKKYFEYSKIRVLHNDFCDIDYNENEDIFKNVGWSENDKKLLDLVTIADEDVFSKDSKYMTVHQAKGLEWQKVFVSINTTRGDSTSFVDMFKNSNILFENPSNEFTRIFYVACSRAIEELYIAIDDVDKPVIQQKLDEYIKEKNISKFYDFI